MHKKLILILLIVVSIIGLRSISLGSISFSQATGDVTREILDQTSSPGRVIVVILVLLILFVYIKLKLRLSRHLKEQKKFNPSIIYAVLYILDYITKPKIIIIIVIIYFSYRWL